MLGNQYKIVLIGDANVGKSSIAKQFVQNKFDEHSEPTIGAAFFTQLITYNNIEYKINIWDTAGQEKYNSLTPMYYRNADAAVIVFDTTNELSLFNCNRWINEFTKISPDTYIILVGNKCDLEKCILTTNLQNIIEKYQIDYLEVSAKTNQNIEKIFNSIIPHLIINNENAPLVHQIEELTKYDDKCRC